MIDLLIAPCGQLLTLASNTPGPRRGSALRDLGLVEGGAVGINRHSGLIEFAGPMDGLKELSLAPEAQWIDASRQVVMPGFVDSHTHLVFAGNRADEFYRRAGGESYQQIAAAGGGIRKTMEATRNASEAELLVLAQARLKQLYANGTTTLEVKSGYGLNEKAELASLRVIQRLKDSAQGLLFATFMGAHLVPPDYAERRPEYIELICGLTQNVKEFGLADFHDIFVDPLAFSQREAEHMIAAGRVAGLPLRLHADEFGDDGSAAWGVKQGAVSVDHLGGVGEDGIAALAASDTFATLLPATMFFTGTGHYAPARRMIDAGCAVALASDFNPGSSLVYSMPFVMTLAVLEMGMSAEEVISAATINGAWALQAASRTGSLEAGKRADLIVLELEHYNEIAYHVGANFVRDVFIGGVRSAGSD